MEVTEKCLWKKRLKRFLNQFADFDKGEQVKIINRRVVQLANALNLEVEVNDIEESVEYANRELSNEDLIEMEQKKYKRNSL